MANFFITGVSSGVGRALTKKLTSQENTVWGIARRKKLLDDLASEIDNPKLFLFSSMDQAKRTSWNFLLKKFLQKKFSPDVIIFNAAISRNDLENGVDMKSLEAQIEVNFLSIMNGIKHLLNLAKPQTQFIAISSFSAFKGSGSEGIGYAASKAALGISFESLYQKYKNKYLFKTIYFGPINSGMSPFKNKTPLILSEDQAVDFILKAIRGTQGQYYCPQSIFLIIKIIKLLPASIYFKILSIMESAHSKYQKDAN